ncbi:hypothetical protein BRD15_07800 [Halobacteriales archaeon SW_6_65_15]|nr:MAG: hypothetical protein BRD15_07800 [Halobacteriales archaeon SW_6_65_15]
MTGNRSAMMEIRVATPTRPCRTPTQRPARGNRPPGRRPRTSCCSPRRRSRWWRCSSRTGSAGSGGDRMAIIDATNLTKHYGDVKAVRGIDLTVEEGSIHGFVGPNGAGKSTTMGMLVGVVTPTVGEAFIGGEPAGSHAALEKIGYAPQEPVFYESMTGRAYLRYGTPPRPRTGDGPRPRPAHPRRADGRTRPAGPGRDHRRPREPDRRGQDRLRQQSRPRGARAVRRGRHRHRRRPGGHLGAAGGDTLRGRGDVPRGLHGRRATRGLAGRERTRRTRRNSRGGRRARGLGRRPGRLRGRTSHGTERRRHRPPVVAGRKRSRRGVPRDDRGRGGGSGCVARSPSSGRRSPTCRVRSCSRATSSRS